MQEAQPLYTRLYFRPEYVALAKAVGYSGLSVEDTKARIQELMKTHDKDKLLKASDELLQFNETWVRLKTDVRRLCWQLLGRPPEAPPLVSAREMVGELKEPPKEEKPKKPRKPRGKKATEQLPGSLGGTPVMQQWREAKERHPGMLLLFRIGDFYELFDEDARTAAKLLGLTLTSRDTTDMAGFPHHSLEPYLLKLVQVHKQKVAVCEQVDSDDGKKAKREVTRVLMRAGTEEETADAIEEIAGQLAKE